MKISISVLCVFLASCSARERTQEISQEFLPGERLAELKNKDLKEVSGIASSVNNPKHIWVHNDAGNKAEVYLLDESLNVKMTCELKGIANRDWEDIAVGPGPDGNKIYVYVGDIGDNDGKHRDKYVYRFQEPVLKEDEKSVVISDFDKITFRLNDGPKDTETLMVDPTTKNLYVVTKREDPVHVYELKYPYDEEVVTAQRTISLPMSRIVGGDLSRDGNEILLKNADDIFYWNGESSLPLIEKMKTPAFNIPYEKEPQGEAITWASDGSGFYTLSEVPKGKTAYLYFYKRNPDR
jgi:hypothetical protein